MCTSITFKDRYFGRTLDLEYHYNEDILITPRNFPLNFLHKDALSSHYAIIGIGITSGGYPLYYDAANEFGLAIAGLNFPGNAVYKDISHTVENLASFELIPYILASFKSVDEAIPFLKRLNITNDAVSSKLPPSPLHWIIADKKRAVTLESTKDGINIYDNPVGVLTNNPPFPYQIFNLNNYSGISVTDPTNGFAKEVPFNAYAKGIGALGLPGDFSSMSRFVKATFCKLNSVCDPCEEASVMQFFKILDSVSFVRGTSKDGEKEEITVYASCCNLDSGVLYYTSHTNRRISAVDMHRENLDSNTVIAYPMISKPDIFIQN